MNRKIRKHWHKQAFLLLTVSAVLFPQMAANADTYATYPYNETETQTVVSGKADQNNFSRSSEEWAKLQDNELDYDEIADLIHEYNATVITNRNSLAKDERKSYDALQVSNALTDAADEYEALADEAEGTSAVLAATYRTQANSLRRQADTNLDDFEVIKLGYEQVEKQTALSARKQFLAYYSALAQKDSTASNLSYLERAYHSAENLRAAEMGTDLEVLTAKEAWENAKASAVVTEQDIASNRMSLMVLCGWKYDADPVIGSLPVKSTEELTAVNYEEDRAKALKNNYAVQMDTIRLNNAGAFGYRALEEEQKNTLKQTTDSFGISFKAAYDALINAGSAYKNAIAAKESGDKDLAYAESQYSLGMISQVELQNARNTNASLDTALQTSYISLLSARAVYDAAVNDGIL